MSGKNRGSRARRKKQRRAGVSLRANAIQRRLKREIKRLHRPRSRTGSGGWGTGSQRRV